MYSSPPVQAKGPSAVVGFPDMNRIRIRKPPLFSFTEAMCYTTRGFDDPRYQVEAGTASTAIEAASSVAVIRVADVGDALAADVLYSELGADTASVVDAHVRRWFDLDRDLQPWRRLVLAAPELVRAAFEPLLGFRIVALPSLFEALGWCILGQQINLAFAYRLKRRISERYAHRVEIAGRTYHLFPEPTALAAASREELRGMQLSYRKADYLIELSRLFRDGEVDEERIANLGDTTAMLSALRSIRGIGEWSAAYGLLKGLSRPDAVPYGDSGLRAGYAALYRRRAPPTRAELEDFFALFPGWEGYAAFYLWRTLLPAPAVPDGG
jgi:DNA-3-methyladenine glycosylase II